MLTVINELDKYTHPSIPITLYLVRRCDGYFKLQRYFRASLLIVSVLEQREMQTSAQSKQSEFCQIIARICAGERQAASLDLLQL